MNRCNHFWKEAPEALPDIHLVMKDGKLTIDISGETLVVQRDPVAELDSGVDPLPSDVDDHIPGS